MTKGAFSILVVLALLSAPLAGVHAAFTDPVDPPPYGSDVAPPINTSSATQTKQGNLTLDGANPVRLEIGKSGETDNQLCLNGVCIGSLIVQDYIRLQGVDGSATPGSTQSGFAELQAKSTQQYALKAQGSEPTTNWTAGLYGLVATSSTGSNERYGVFGRTIYDSAHSYGVYGYAEYDAAYAGYFEGRARVTGDLLVSPYTNDAGDVVDSRICLNDPGDSSQCITRWPFSETEQFVRLQKTDSPVQDSGSLSISGSGSFSSVVLGTPAAETPLVVTCGDGVCQGTNSNPDETQSSCSLDCFTVQNVNIQKYVSSATISWNTGVQPTTGDVDYGQSTFYTDDVQDANFATTHGPLTLSGLIANTTYFYRITSISESGAVAAASGSFTTLTSDNVDPAKVANLRVNGSVTWNTVPLAWDAATDNVAVLYYLLERDSGTGFAQVGGPIYATTYEDTSVSPSSTYTYRVRAVDSALNEGATSDALIVATTSVPADTAPPSVPTALTHSGLAYYDNIQLSWTASTDIDSGMKQYNVYRKKSSEAATEWKLIGTTTGTTYTDNGPLLNVTQYDYAVTAVDNALNESDKSDPHTVATEPDTTDPAVPGNVFLTGTPSTTSIGIVWHVSTDTGGSGLAGYRMYRYDCVNAADPSSPWDDYCDASVTLNPDSPAAGWTLVLSTQVWYAYDITFTPGHQYRYSIVAYDNAGNLSGPSEYKDVYAPYDNCTSAEQCDVENSSAIYCCTGVCKYGCTGGGGGGRDPFGEL